jgi:hypothetical protein
MFVGLPGIDEREQQIALNIENQAQSKNKSKDVDIINYEQLAAHYRELAEMTEGFTGRELFDLVVKFKDAAVLAETRDLTWDLALTVAEKVVKQHAVTAALRAQQSGHTYFDASKIGGVK